MTGSLDCETGEFDGELDGYYFLFDLGELNQWFFKGPLTAHFEGGELRLDEGVWDMMEIQTTEPDGAGGEGTWEAQWKSETGPELPPECLEVINGGPADAGT